MVSNQCWCFHVKTCATIVSIIGIVFSILAIVASILSLFSSIFYWYYIPLASFSLIIYILVLIGVCKEDTTFLFSALFFLGVEIIFKISFFIGFLLIGIRLPIEIIKKFGDESNGDVIRVAFIVSSGIVFLLTIYSIFAFTVILRTRKYFNSLIGEDTFKNIIVVP